MSKFDLNALTLKEKIELCSGLNEWDTKGYPQAGIPSVKVADGPHGLRKTVGAGDNLGLSASEPATCFPTASLVACSFDRSLTRLMGASIAQEAHAAGVCTVLGPGVNMKRNPLCGRNFEYYSEDPYLAGQLAIDYIQGMQSQGIGTSLKHFACNSQEYHRMTSDSRMSERALRELYLPAFEMAVTQGKPATVMCAYNLLNGISCSDNHYLLTQILRNEWGYEGMVVSDWGALNNRRKAFEAGCDLIMPGGSGFEEDDVLHMVEKGELDERVIDVCASRVATFATSRKEMMEQYHHEANFLDHHKIAQSIAEQSAVLLKNDDEILPLSWEDTCIIGNMAEHYRIQGSGSSKINPVHVDGLEELLKKVPYAPGYQMDGSTTDELIEQAKEKASHAKKIVIFAGLPEQYEAEGLDRRHMSLPEGQNKLIDEISRVHDDVVVVLVCGCVVELPWADQVKGILWMGLAGEAGVSACVNLLTGVVNPSGKLAETWPMRYEDCPSSHLFLKQGKHAEYHEGLYIGYRYYDKAQVPVRFPFGHGLSYTQFEYDNLQVSDQTVTVTIKNTGKYEGKEAVLMYIHTPQDGIHCPLKELKGFTKVTLSPQESTTVSFTLDERSFAVWNDGWVVYQGDYTIDVGTQTSTIHVAGQASTTHEATWYDTCKGTPSREDWLKTLSSPIQETIKTEYDVNSTVQDIAKDSLFVRLLYRWFENQQAKLFGRGSTEYLSAMSAADECPLRTVQGFLGMKHHFAQAIADFGNKHPLQGIIHFFR